MQDNNSKAKGRAGRGKAALPAALVLAEILLGGFVLAGELGRQASLPWARGSAGSSRHAGGDALLAIGGVALLYACLRGRVALAKAMGKGSVWSRQSHAAGCDGGMWPVGASAGQTGQCPSTQPPVGGPWRGAVRGPLDGGEDAESAIIRPQAGVMRNHGLHSGIRARWASLGKKK